MLLQCTTPCQPGGRAERCPGRVLPGQCEMKVQTLCLGKRTQNHAAPGNTSAGRAGRACSSCIFFLQ